VLDGDLHGELDGGCLTGSSTETATGRSSTGPWMGRSRCTGSRPAAAGRQAADPAPGRGSAGGKVGTAAQARRTQQHTGR
jgi:hypothetical protein